MRNNRQYLTAIFLASCLWGCQGKGSNRFYNSAPLETQNPAGILFDSSDFFYKLSVGSIELTHHAVMYDANYFSIPYPNGDIPEGKGVCSDVVIRAYRKMGIDLQKDVHEDMQKHFSQYPQLWGLKHTDTNIDHRRVPNLMCYFDRHQASLPITNNGKDYQYGDIVAWDIGNGQTHIGIVTHLKSHDGSHYLIAHNIGSGQILSDFLFDYKIIGHYRFKKSV